MSKMIRILFVTVLASILLMSTVFAVGAQGGSCPPGFSLHMAHEHDDEHHTGHPHVGTDADQNGDGYICVKHLTSSVEAHVHIDNAVK